MRFHRTRIFILPSEIEKVISNVPAKEAISGLIDLYESDNEFLAFNMNSDCNQSLSELVDFDTVFCVQFGKNQIYRIISTVQNKILDWALLLEENGIIGEGLSFTEEEIRKAEQTPIINNYICGCGSCDWNLEEEIKKVQGSYGRLIFSLGETDEEEVRNVYAVLRFLVETNNSVYCGVAIGYSSSSKWQDKIKGFNERFVMVLIRHVERYLTKIGIDMGIDEKNVYNVTVQNGQAIIANDNSTVTATTHIGVNANELERLIAAVRTKMDTLTDTDKEAASESLEVIEAEIVSEKPKKSMIKTAITSLQAIKGVAEFGAAVSALIQFIGPMLS